MYSISFLMSKLLSTKNLYKEVSLHELEKLNRNSIRSVDVLYSGCVVYEFSVTGPHHMTKTARVRHYGDVIGD